MLVFYCEAIDEIMMWEGIMLDGSNVYTFDPDSCLKPKNEGDYTFEENLGPIYNNVLIDPDWVLIGEF